MLNKKAHFSKKGFLHSVHEDTCLWSQQSEKGSSSKLLSAYTPYKFSLLNHFKFKHRNPQIALRIVSFPDFMDNKTLNIYCKFYFTFKNVKIMLQPFNFKKDIYSFYSNENVMELNSDDG